jgi:hypothetical protein
VASFGTAVRLAGWVTATRRYAGLRSEDVALLTLQWDDGVPGNVEVIGVTGEESYAVTVHTTDGDRSVVLRGGPGTESALGYSATIEAFLGMVRGAPSPVPWAETRAILGVLAEAREATSPRR